MKNILQSKIFNILILLIVILIFLIFLIILYKIFKSNNEHFNNLKNSNQDDVNKLFDTIPKIIYLCYKTKDIPDYIIPKWKELNPDYTIILYDNQDCINFLRDNYGEEYVNIFDFIK